MQKSKQIKHKTFKHYFDNILLLVLLNFKHTHLGQLDVTFKIVFSFLHVYMYTDVKALKTPKSTFAVLYLKEYELK